MFAMTVGEWLQLNTELRGAGRHKEDSLGEAATSAVAMGDGPSVAVAAESRPRAETDKSIGLAESAVGAGADTNNAAGAATTPHECIKVHAECSLYVILFTVWRGLCVGM